MIGDFEIKEEDLAGRIGIIETRHGKIETPVFFPVINPLKTEIGVNDLVNLGFKNFITNSFILKKNSLADGDIHQKFGDDLIIMTDSGAYQILEYGDINETNRAIVEYQAKIRPDIAVFLDVPTGNKDSWDEAKKTVEITLERGREIIDIVRNNQDIIWVHPIQGGTFLDLVELSAKETAKANDYGMYALGSPTVLMEKYRYSELIEMIHVAKSNVSRGKPFHLFGGGTPQVIPFAVALGVDSFDSASYIIFARDERYLTRERTYRLEELDYFPCSCPVCSKYSPQELRELSKEDREKLLAFHNLWKIREEINATKQAIKEGRLFEYLQQKAFSHPSVYSAFRSLLTLSDYLEKYDPRVKGEVKGLFLFDSSSLARPELVRHVNYVSKLSSRRNEAIIICGDRLKSPFFTDSKVKSIYSKYSKNADIYVAIPFYGLIPVLSSESFPMAQFEAPAHIHGELIEETLTLIKKMLDNKKYSKVSFIECESSVLSHIVSIYPSS
jgi:7-cyano-7-deazaguanine tRNA-ribosyltransferase